MTATATPHVHAPAQDAPAKPDGGYRIITVGRLAVAWWVYKEGLVRLADLRVWFACHELDARRCRRPDGVAPSFHPAELCTLSGLSLKRVRASLRRLDAARVLTWGGDAIGFPGAPDALPVPADRRAAFAAFLALFSSLDRIVPVPRRMLRVLAGGARPALIAAVIALCVRGLFLKGGACRATGWVKASWVAETFGVSERRVQDARRHLKDLGWLVALEAGQSAMNRLGARFRINLRWSRVVDAPAATAAGGTETVTPPVPKSSPPVRTEIVTPPGAEIVAPPPPVPAPGSSPPSAFPDQEPLPGAKKDQKPAPGGPSGIFMPDGGRGRESTPESEPLPPELQAGYEAFMARAAAYRRNQGAPETTPAVPVAAPPRPTPATVLGSSRASALFTPPPRPETSAMLDPRASRPTSPPAPASPDAPGAPDFRNVVPEDLKDVGRLLVLYAQAQALGLVTSSECDRLRFLSAAEHARVIGTRNPCGLFASLVRRGLWRFATQDDEDAASSRLKRHLHGRPDGR